MFNNENIDDLKKHLDENGKLIISDDLTESQKIRFNMINSMDVDLITILSRKSEFNNYPDVEEIDENDEGDIDDVEVLEDSFDSIDYESDDLIEDDSSSVADLENFF